MIFGAVQTVTVGFLLTASRNWASQLDISNRFINVIIISWLHARLAG
jgi:uncharacterized protein involved in response to NO